MMKLPFYIYSRILQYWFQHAVIYLIITRREFTLFQYSKTLSSIITSIIFDHIPNCIIFDICYMMNQQYYIYSRILPVLISTCCIEFNHYKMRIYSITVFYNTLKRNRTRWTNSTIYIPEYSQYSYQHAVINLINTRREFTLFQYSKTLSSIITSFCIIFDICNMMKLPFYIYSRILPVLISTCCNLFNHYKTWIYSISVF